MQDRAGQGYTVAGWVVGLLVGLVVWSRLSSSSGAETWTFGAADGRFETDFTGMEPTGDVRLVDALGALRPTQGTQAVLLTTAPESGTTPATATHSVLHIPAIVVPAATPHLRLDYNLLTREPAPSFTNDTFTVTLRVLTPAGEETLRQVDTFPPTHPAPLTGYAWQTGFRTLVADLSAYAGSLVALELRLTDGGDGRGDSAVLLDQLQWTSADAPVACVTTEYLAVAPGEAVVVDGTCSTAPAGGLVDARWDFGDGAAAVGVTATHTYPTDGLYQATLTITDAAGQTPTETFLVAVGNLQHPPQMISVPPVLAAALTPYHYAVVGDDPDQVFGDVLTFQLVEAPGGMVIDAATGRLTWTPPADGPPAVPVTVQATDLTGLQATQSFTLIIGPEVYLLATDDAGRLYYARSLGDGTFTPAEVIGDTGSYTRGAAIADFDGDGDFDVISGDADSSGITLYFYAKQGATFAPPVFLTTLGDTTTPAGGYLMDMAAADVNHDGAMDLVVNSNAAATWLLLNDLPHPDTATPTFQVRLLPNTGSAGRGLAAADVNDDGFIDLARARSDGQIFLYTGDGTGQFTPGTTAVVPGSHPYGVALADLDGDGHIDLLANNSTTGDAYWYAGNGAGAFGSVVLVATLDTHTSTAYDVYDFNADGQPDLAAATYTSRQIQVYPGHGAAAFGLPVLVGSAASQTLGIATPAGRVLGQPLNLATVASDHVAIGEAVTFDAQASVDDGAIIRIAWDFGDGTTAEGAVVTHAFDAEGLYAVVATVTDDTGLQDRRRLAVTVQGAPPIADAGGPYVFPEATAAHSRWPVMFDGSASLDLDSAIIRYDWDIDDRDGLGVDLTGVRPPYVYTTPGTYTVTLTVYDTANQATQTTTTVTVTAGARPVAAVTGPAVVDEMAAALGQWAVRVDLRDSTDDVGVLTYRVDWGDGQHTTIAGLRETFDDGELTTHPTWTIHGGTWQVIDGQVHQTETSSSWKWLQDLATPMATASWNSTSRVSRRAGGWAWCSITPICAAALPPSCSRRMKRTRPGA